MVVMEQKMASLTYVYALPMCDYTAGLDFG